jgi:hypothetical protein
MGLTGLLNSILAGASKIDIGRKDLALAWYGTRWAAFI